MIYRRRRTIAIVFIIIAAIPGGVYESRQSPSPQPAPTNQQSNVGETQLAADVLTMLEVKGRAPKTDYRRAQFGDGWADFGGCDVRNLILQRDLTELQVEPSGCKVISGTFLDPYTAKTIRFFRGGATSADVQIDHIVSLSDAWQKGAQQLSFEERERLANDSLNLLAVDGAINMKKSNGDAATWLPPNKPYRCQFVARQIAVKQKYRLWTTSAERDAMKRVLTSCPEQRLPYDVSR